MRSDYILIDLTILFLLFFKYFHKQLFSTLCSPICQKKPKIFLIERICIIYFTNQHSSMIYSAFIVIYRTRKTINIVKDATNILLYGCSYPVNNKNKIFQIDSLSKLFCLMFGYSYNDGFIDSCGRSKISHELCLLVANRLEIILLIITHSMLLVLYRNILYNIVNIVQNN